MPKRVSDASQLPMLSREDVVTNNEDIATKMKFIAEEDKQNICSNSELVEVTFKRRTSVLHFKV